MTLLSKTPGEVRAAAPPRGPRALDRLRGMLGPKLQGALVLTALLCAFFWTPLSRYDEVFFSSADLTQDFCLTKLDPDHKPGNKLLSDAVTQMQPWAMFNRAEIEEGRFPLWNTWNGAGCPHFANYQSAVLSPFSFPYYVFDFKAALLLTAFLKLFAIGFFTFLFLKEVGLGQVPALIGGTAFMFGGHNVLLLSFPHVGTLAALPASFYFSEVVLHRFQRAAAAGTRARLFAPLAALALVLAGGLLAGNPEPFYFSLVLLCAYLSARLVVLSVSARRRGESLLPLARVGGSLVLAGVVGGGLAAVQIVPFFEFLENSRVVEQRTISRVQTPLDPAFWPLAVFPDAIGNPSTPYNISYLVPPPNYELVNTAYLGGTVLFLAGLALFFLRRDRRIVFFAIAAALWACYAYNVFGLAVWLSYVPTVSIAPINRSQGVWLFCVSVLAALAAESLLRRESRRNFEGALVTALGAAGFLTVFLIGADRLMAPWATVPSPNHHLFLHYVPEHIRWFGRLFALGAGSAVFAWLARGSLVRNALALGMLAAVFLASGHHFRDYNPVTENRFFFPATPAISELQQHVGHARLAIFGEDQIPPTSNLAYRLSLVQNYDGMWVRSYDSLYRVAFGDGNNWRPMTKASVRMLAVFGVEYVLAKWGWLPVDTGLARLNRPATVGWVRQEIFPGAELEQTFVSGEPDLQAVSVYLSCTPTTRHCTLKMTLTREDTGELVCEREISSEDVRADIYTMRHVQFESEPRTGLPGRFVVFPFSAEPDSQGVTYRLRLSVKDGVPGNTINAWSASVQTYKRGGSTRGAQPLAGELLFDFSHCYDEFEEVARIDGYVLYRFRGPGRHWVVGGAVIAENDSEVLGLLRAPTFDPRRLVVLSTDDEEAVAASTAMGPRDNSGARLIKKADSVKVYLVSKDQKSLVHIEDEATFLANKFRWDQIETVPDEEFDRYTISETDFDAERNAGLRVVAPEEKNAKPPRVLVEDSTFLRIEVERENPGYLVVAKAHFPGWKARVNGVEQPLYRANYAFDAVQLSPGQNLVEISYEPDSLRYGLWISAASLLVGLGSFLVARRGHARARELRDAPGLESAPSRPAPRIPLAAGAAGHSESRRHEASE